MKRFERSNGLDTALYKNYLFFIHTYIQHAMNRLNNNRASGSDELPGELLKHGSNVIAKPIADIFNRAITDHLPFTIYHQGFFHSVRRNPSLNCFHRRRSLAILGHAVPRWRTRLSLHLVLGLPCRLVHSRGVHYVTLLVHLLSLKRAMCPAHPCIPFLITSMMSFTPV